MMLKNIIPSYNEKNLEISGAHEAINALDAYVCNRISQVDISSFVPKFARLIRAIKAIPHEKSESLLELQKKYPQIKGHLALLERCIESYNKILSGKMQATEVLFPDGSFDLVEKVYTFNAIADHFNSVVAQIVENYLKESNRAVKILEIGAGTGGTTGFVLPRIKSFDVSYDFTDVSLAFLNKAKKKFRDYPFVKYSIFDVSSGDSNKIIDEYDIIIATNVIHATPDLNVTLKNVCSRLCRGGIFILNEITTIQNFATVVFGLTDGWWLYNDSYRIENSPLVTGSVWQTLINSSGMSFVGKYGGDEQQVMVATKRYDIKDKRNPPFANNRAVIKSTISKIMLMDESDIDDDVPFQEYGIDSIISLELIKPLKEIYGYLPATLLFEYPTVNALSEYLEKNFKGVIQQQKEERRIVSDSVVKKNLATEERGVKDTVKSVISKVMLIDKSDIDDDVPFQEYGIDSIISLELIKPLKEIYGYLPATLLFEYPTVNALSEYLDKNFKGVIQQQKEERRIVSESIVKENLVTERSGIKDIVKGVISKVMLIDKSDIDDDVPFQEYGIDSIISLELIKPLKEIYGYLPATLLFEYPTVNTLSEYLIMNFANNTEVSSEVNSYDLPCVTDISENGSDFQYEGKYNFKEDDIAIIGMACNFPQAKSPSEFADNLARGADCTSDIPSDRWSLDSFIKTDSPLNGGSYTARGAFIDDVYSFDNAFFNLTPNEASKMDPQERLFLQNSFHLVQDAGYRLEDIKGSDTGVYVGVMNSPYCLLTPRKGESLIPTSLRWSIANRVSYIFDLHGPSMAIDTACSSSLSALHIACLALKNGDCKQAIVGGVNLILHPKQYEALCALYMLSKTGVCRPFGEGADGFVDGEGIGSVFIKKYKDALRDNDRIYAVIRASVVNSGGKANGYTAPNVQAQSSLIDRALKMSGLEGNDIGYVEAHGTGTELGDPIEIKGLTTVFSGVKNKIAVGSVKSNIGHLESAAGISGLIKVLLQMQRNVFFPSIHADEENTHIKFKDTPFYVNKVLKQCSDSEIMNAAISSFGAGGANAHVVLSKFIKKPDTDQESEFYFITISAKTANALQKYMTTLIEWLSKNYVDIYSLAYTLNCTRDHFKFRRVFVVKNQDELLELLKIDLDESSKYSLHELSGDFIKIVKKYEAGEFVDWGRIYRRRSLISVPCYEFEKNNLRISSIEYPLIDDQEIITQHNIKGRCVAPAALTILKIFNHFGNQDLYIRNLRWLKPVVSSDQINIELESLSEFKKIRFVSNGSDELFCEAECNQLDVAKNYFKKDVLDYRFMNRETIYKFFENMRYLYGKDMQSLQWAKISKNLAKGFLSTSKNWGYSISPALLDGGLQLAILLFNNTGKIAKDNFVPICIDECYIKSFNGGDALYCYCVQRAETKPYSIICDFYYVNSKGELIVKLKGVRSVSLKNSLKNEKVSKRLRVVHFD